MKAAALFNKNLKRLSDPRGEVPHLPHISPISPPYLVGRRPAEGTRTRCPCSEREEARWGGAARLVSPRTLDHRGFARRMALSSALAVRRAGGASPFYGRRGQRSCRAFSLGPHCSSSPSIDVRSRQGAKAWRMCIPSVFGCFVFVH